MPVCFRPVAAGTALSLLACGTFSSASAQASTPSATRARFTVEDLHRIKDVADPALSPDGRWVAYSVRTHDVEKDQRTRDLYMSSWDGGTTLRLTTTREESEGSPSWSPDGKHLAFLSSRGDENESEQLWLLPVAGGEAEKVTGIKRGVSDYDWAPDGRRLVLAIEDGDSVDQGAEDSTGKEKTPKPIVVDRYYFKEDYVGYLGRKRTHLYLFDLATRTLTPLTTGTHDELLPSWSPDGKWIAFVSKQQGDDPDRGNNWDLFVVEPRPGATPKRLTSFEGADNEPVWEARPAWSPDGTRLAYMQGGVDKLLYYARQSLAVVPVTGGPATVLTASLDRNVFSPAWSADGARILFRLEDDRSVYLASVPAAGGEVVKHWGARHVLYDFAVGENGKVALLASSATAPLEVFAYDGGEPRPLSRMNDSLLAARELAGVEETSFRSKDGTTINGFIYTPPGWRPGTQVPALLRIHGGPVSQYEHDFDIEWQILAARGYAIVAANPRGSSGRGEKFSLAIYADWGNKDAQDVLAAVDDAIKRGIADPARLGVGGWSYGGILTNYVIAQDSRFKAATSGAGISNILAGYGTDMYIREYEAELGQPWTNTDTWLKLSFPFLKANRIKTPTLFLCGEKDFNVPLLNSEQMYQALRSLGVDTQLIIYPDQYHGLSKPSYLQDRLERYLDWYDRHLGVSRTNAAR